MGRRSSWLLILLFILLGSLRALAADSTSLRLGSDQYIRSDTAYFRDSASASDTSLSLIVQKEWRIVKSIKFKTDLQNEFSGAERWNYLNIHQAYLTSKLPEQMRVDLGRKRETWASFDDEWKQGVFEPRYLQNKLNPQSAGLTGVYFSAPVRSWFVTAAVLPIHIPDLGAHFDVEDNHFVSRNPWFVPPADTYQVRAPSPIHYDVDKPSMSEVAAHPGAALKVERSGARFGLRMAAAYKPVPQFLVRFPSENRVVISSQADYLDIRIQPTIVYHAVGALESWTEAGGWTLTGSVAYDRPDPVSVPNGYTSQTFSPAWLWSLQASHALGLEGSEAARIKFGLLKVDGGVGEDKGEFARQTSLFEGRFQYNEAYLAALYWPIRGWFRRPMITEARIVYDRLQNGGMVGLSAGYSLLRDWRIDGSFDFLGLMNGPAQVSDGFFSRFRSNDRVGLGMSYVF